MSEQRRAEIAEVIERHDLILIEDDAYALVQPHADRPVASLLPDCGVFLAGLSKIMGAGLRTAYVVAGRRVRLRIAQALLNTMWMASPLVAALVATLILDGTADEAVKRKRETARERFAIARRLLRGHQMVGPDTGFFVWLYLPELWQGNDIEVRAQEAGVNIFAAERFVVGSNPAPPAVRLSLTGPASQAELSRGLQVIADILSGRPVGSRPIM